MDWSAGRKPLIGGIASKCHIVNYNWCFVHVAPSSVKFHVPRYIFMSNVDVSGPSGCK